MELGEKWKIGDMLMKLPLPRNGQMWSLGNFDCPYLADSSSSVYKLYSACAIYHVICDHVLASHTEVTPNICCNVEMLADGLEYLLGHPATLSENTFRGSVIEL